MEQERISDFPSVRRRHNDARMRFSIERFYESACGNHKHDSRLSIGAPSKGDLNTITFLRHSESPFYVPVISPGTCVFALAWTRP